MNEKPFFTLHSSLFTLKAKRGATLMLLMVCCMAAAGQVRYRTAELQRLAEIVGKDSANQHRYVIHQTDSIVDHVGIRLFPDEMKRVAKAAVLPFLERYFLQLRHPSLGRTPAQMMRDDGFRFERGNMQTIEQLRDSDAFSYNFELRRYRASWSRNGKELLAVSFPKQYELLAGVNKIEAEELLEGDIRTSPKTTPTTSPSPSEGGELSSLNIPAMHSPPSEGSGEVIPWEGTGDVSGFLILPGVPYIDKRINSDLYVEKRDSTYRLIVDVRHPAESTANMLLSRFAPGDYTLCVDQTCYGYKRKKYEVQLRQWLSFCMESGCDVYCGIEEVTEKEVKASVFVVNQAEGYNHVLYVEVPLTTIDNHKGPVHARLDCYIPMHNVAGLFAKEKKKRNKEPKIYERRIK